MFPTPSLPWFELVRFRRSRLTRAAVLAVLIVPLCYGALYVWANLNPPGHVDRIDAAIVNEDKPVKMTDEDGDEQTVPIGRELAANLISNDSKQNYNWYLTDAADARKGLADGKYRTVLTIPKNLSKAATSTDGDPTDAIQGVLDLQTNDAINYINGNIATSVTQAARSAMNSEVTETYLDNVYLRFSDMKSSLQDAADGAGQLADGAGELADGTGQLANGAHRLSDGAGTLAGGLDTIVDQTSSLPSQTEQLASGAEQVAEGNAQINQMVQQIAGTVNQAAGTADQRLDELKDVLNDVVAECRQTSPKRICDRIEEASASVDGKVRPFISQATDEVNNYARQSQRLADGSRQVAEGNRELANAMPELVSGLRQADDGAHELQSGASRLASGADDAHDGAKKLESGADELASKLDKGSKQIPDYNSDEREHLAETVATPFTQDNDRANSVGGYGAALAPYFMALAMWVGAMAIYLILRPLSRRALASTVSSLRVGLAGLLPALALSFVQAALLVTVLAWIIGMDPVDLPLVFAVAAALAVAYTALNQMLVAVFGPAGRFIAIVFVCLQLTAAGGTYPIETSPGFFSTMHVLLPMSYAVDGFRKAIAGSHVGLTQDFVVLTIWALGAFALTLIAARRQRKITMTRLHPTLEV